MSRRALTYGHSTAALFLEPLCYPHTDVFVGNSPAVVEELKREVPNADIRLIRNGIEFKPLPHQDSGKYTILCVANVWKHKHHETLIEAVQFIAAELPDPWRLVLVGRGTEQFNNLPNVYGYGYRTDIPEILSTADLFVMPSCAEGCPNAVLEAMVAGVPVIAAGAGGNLDVVQHGFTGVLVPPQRSDKLAYAILAAVKCPREFGFMAENAKADVASRFSMKACIEQHRQLYEG